MIMSRTIIATPPGYTIREQLEQRGMTQKEFSVRMDMSEKHISRLINGEVRLTPNVSMRLETILGIPSEFWNKLEAIYQMKKQKAEEENALDSDIEIEKKIPYTEMVKLGWVEYAKKAADRVKNLRRFFEVAHLTVIDRLFQTGIAYRRAGITNRSKYVLASWIQKARLSARERKVSGINLQELAARIAEIRELTLRTPDEYIPRLTEILSDCGIVLVILPHLKGSYLNGASFIDGKKIVTALTLRGNYADIFWFSLFHEIYHILEGQMTQTEELTEEDERKADEYSEDVLIPRKEYENFVKAEDFTLSSLKEFAKQEGVDVGILIGRLQKEEHIDFSEMNHLRQRLVT